jgi:hypothetical protein
MSLQVGRDRGAPQVPPLRFAPVGMTRKGQLFAIDLQSASLRMTALFGGSNTACWICRNTRVERSQARVVMTILFERGIWCFQERSAELQIPSDSLLMTKRKVGFQWGLV